ncbi:MAG: sensor histidine kinase FleS [Gammaproteobacteria bacterium]|nr:MAG: sensor histidine kinase FleS [Gammaproteobacteria bacterium]
MSFRDLGYWIEMNHLAAQSVDLEEAFQVFNELSEQLIVSYQGLEHKVSALTSELESVHGERKKQLAEKEKLAARLEQLLHALPGGVIVLDMAGVVRECNPAAEKLLGTPLLKEAWREVIARAFIPGSDGYEVRLKSGALVNVSISTLKDEPGQILLINDLTETRQLQDKLNHNSRLAAMGEMVARLAHQLRTPLASALLYSSNVSSANISACKQEKLATRLHSNLLHLESLIKDMLLFAREGINGREALKVSTLISQLQEMVKPLVLDKGARVKVIDNCANASVYVNKDSILGALQNMIDNALQACVDSRAEIILHARMAPANAIDLVVQDNGPGIPESQKEKIFEPFFTTRSQGTGLGLAVVHAVARAHDGAAWLESEVGGGCQIGIRLPLMQASFDLESQEQNLATERRV